MLPCFGTHEGDIPAVDVGEVACTTGGGDGGGGTGAGVGVGVGAAIAASSGLWQLLED